MSGSWRELSDWHCSPVSRGMRWVRKTARTEVMRNYKNFSRQARNDKKIGGAGWMVG